MSAIVNYRDLLLQAASPRVLPVLIEAASVIIEADATTVTGPTTGATTPANITLTAKLLGGLSGTVMWSVVSGTATLTPAGNTCLISGSSMAIGSVLVKATLVTGIKTFTAQINLVKIRDTTDLENEVNSLLNNSKDLVLSTSDLTFSGNTPSSITLTAVRKNGLVGAVAWSVTAGSASLTSSGDTCQVSASSVPSGSSVTVRGRVSANGRYYDAFVTLTKHGLLSKQDTINLNTQVTGQLAAGNVSGLGALAMLNAVNLNTQTVGALNGQTQVTNLGTLAYANAIAANQIGAGTLAAGVVYAGEINANKITSGELVGRTIKTATSGARIELAPGATPSLTLYSSSGFAYYLTPNGMTGGGGDNSLLSGFVSDASFIHVSNHSATHATAKFMNNSGAHALELSGTMKWNGVNLAKPAGSGTKFLRDDGQWATP